MKKEYIYSILIVITLTGCFDDAWLEQKRDIKLIVPQSLSDLRLLLNDDDNLSKDNVNLAELSGDDYYIPDIQFETQEPMIKNIHLWDEEFYADNSPVPDWDRAFGFVLLANIVLEGVEKIEPSQSEGTEWNDIKGSALFLRAKTMFFLAQQFCKPYDVTTASTDLGLPIRRRADTSEPIVRSTVEQTYIFIKADLVEASRLLRDLPTKVTNPSKAAAFALLARLCLVMGDFENGLLYSNQCLQLKGDLLDFNTLDVSSFFVMPPPQNNPEIIQYSEMSIIYAPYVFALSRVSDEIYSTYDDNDLRKVAWFINMGSGSFGSHSFKGSYTAFHTLFSGLTTSEVYLMRAECKARLNDATGAIDDLNIVLVKRYTAGTFNPRVAESPDVLNIVLEERRKELLRRGLRWSDLRRLNAKAETSESIARTIDGVEYILSPGDLRYTLPIPNYVIVFNGMQQNPR